MRFLRKNKIKKTILVISDQHLGAGMYYEGKRNLLEDFHFDKEMVEFLDFYCTGEYANREVELIINGDFFDLLAVPYVKYFDDEYWSEEAALEKLKIIIEAHPEVMEALKEFVNKKNKKVVYIIGNHDAELVLTKVQQHLRDFFSNESFIISNEIETYNPHKGIYIQHGHQYELAHDYSPEDSIIKTNEGVEYFIPPWGSYYVVRIINKFKVERSYINEVRPIKNFLIHGLIFDTFFTMRFMFANIYYFVMVRFWNYLWNNPGWSVIQKQMKQELKLFQNFTSLTRDFFEEHPDAKALIVGHTHHPSIHYFSDGTTFVNTGTWTKMINLDFARMSHGHSLTYAQIDIAGKEEQVEIDLHEWKGKTESPYQEFV
jgi:UDP-2,3-diacylglucosamine pyrophosphatase LpxH